MLLVRVGIERGPAKRVCEAKVGKNEKRDGVFQMLFSAGLVDFVRSIAFAAPPPAPGLLPAIGSAAPSTRTAFDHHGLAESA